MYYAVAFGCHVASAPYETVLLFPAIFAAAYIIARGFVVRVRKTVPDAHSIDPLPIFLANLLFYLCIAYPAMHDAHLCLPWYTALALSLWPFACYLRVFLLRKTHLESREYFPACVWMQCADVILFVIYATIFMVVWNFQFLPGSNVDVGYLCLKTALILGCWSCYENHFAQKTEAIREDLAKLKADVSLQRNS